jgi:hypothetical protein
MSPVGAFCLLAAATVSDTALPRTPAAYASIQDSKPARNEPQDPQKALPEYELKAGFLFQFAKYVAWPASAFDDAKSPIVIGVLGQDPFGVLLERILKDKTVQGRGFRIERFAAITDLKACHILFVPQTNKLGIAAIAKQLDKSPTLTIGEAAGFARQGGAISIVVKDEKPKLEVNVDAALMAGLTIDARLLKAATVVTKEK